MIDMFLNSVVLFFKGKLFQNQHMALLRSTVSALVAAGVCVILALVGVPLALAIIIAAVAGGVMQPFLFKDLRYR
jgi:hypothetical protein